MVDVPEGVQIAGIYAGLATTVITVLGVPLVGMWISRSNAKTALMAEQVKAAAAQAALAAANVTAVAAAQAANVKKVDEIAIAQVAVADKTDATAEKMVAVQQRVDDRSEKRGQQIDAVGAKLEAVQAVLENGLTDTLKAVAVKMDHAIDKVETVVTTAGIAVNRMNDVRRTLTVQAGQIGEVATAQAADGAKIVEAGEKFEKLATSLSVAQVKATVDSTADKVDEIKGEVKESRAVIDGSRTMLNSQMGVVLENWRTSAQTAFDGDPSPKNKETLERASKALEEHVAAQKIVDAGKKTVDADKEIEARP